MADAEKVQLGAAIAQWIRLRLPSCCNRFESQAHHLCFHQFIELCNVEKTKINKKGLGLAHFFLKKCRRQQKLLFQTNFSASDLRGLQHQETGLSVEEGEEKVQN